MAGRNTGSMNRPASSDEIRQTFIEFFTSRQHLQISAASVIPVNDPTLLFINAGMAPLKSYFLGEALPPAPDLCNVQPCVRTIDIADVGDRHHLTFFEMLGSWSIGHYFKDRAVELAFELLTDGFGFSPDELYVTVYQGSEELRIPPDDISAAAWRRATPGRAARAPRCSTTPARRTARSTGQAASSTPPAGTSRSGMPASSWNSTGSRAVPSSRCGSPASTPAPDWNAWPWCCRAGTPSTRLTCSPRSWRRPGRRWPAPAPASATSGSSPTTSGPRPSSSA